MYIPTPANLPSASALADVQPIVVGKPKNSLLRSPLFTSPVFVSGDIDVTTHNVMRDLNEHKVRVNQGELDASLYKSSYGCLSFFGLRYGASVSVTPKTLEKFYLVQLPLEGVADVHIGSETFRATQKKAAVLSPAFDMNLDLESMSTQLLIKIPVSDVRRVCESILGHPLSEHIVFNSEMALDEPSGASLLPLLRYYLNQPSAVPQWKRSMPGEDLLIAHLLTNQGSNILEKIRTPPKPASPRYVNSAETFMRDRLDCDLCLSDIALSVGVSTRALSQGFVDHRGMSPMKFLMNLRLEAVRKDLQRGEHLTVASAAMQWGFTHLGRFAVAYRHKFGESPAMTLKPYRVEKHH